MLVVHHLGISQSERIVWLCEELGIAYDLKRYDRDPASGMAPAEYKALHPMGIAPVITDDDLVLSESGAIIDYIVAKYGDGRLSVGAGAPNFADYLFWFHFANGTLMPSAMSAMTASRSGASGDNPRLAFIKDRTNRALGMLEKRLGEAPYLAGDELTAADIMNLFPLTTMRKFAPIDLAAYPNIRAYLGRIGERPAYRRAMEKGDPGMELRLD